MSRLFAPLMALLLLGSLVAPASVGGPVGTAQAATECDWVDDVAWVTGLGPWVSPECQPSKLSEEAAAIENTSQNQTHLDLYDSMVAQGDLATTSWNVHDSYVNDTRTTAFIKAENATINALDAGKTRSQTNTSARNAVSDYYTESQQDRLYETWNNQVLSAKYAHDRSVIDGIAAESDRTNVGSHGGSTNTADKVLDFDYTFSGYGWMFADITGYTKTNVTTINGTTREVWAVDVRVDLRDDNTGNTVTTINKTLVPGSGDTTFSDGNGQSLTIYAIEAEPPSGSTLSNKAVVDLSRPAGADSELRTASTQISDNAEAYASTLYDAKQNGTLNASEYTSPYLLAQEYSTSWNETGYWSYAVSSLSTLGLETPDLNNTGVMDVTYNGVTTEGLIMSDSAPNGSWETNKTYNASALEGRQWLVTTTGERLVLDGKFTISEMTNQQGEQINSTKTIKYVYQGTNESEYEDLQMKILDLQQEIEERAPAGGGAAGDDGFFGLSNLQVAGVAVVVVGGGLLLGGGGGAAGAAGGAFGGSGGSGGNMARRRKR